MYSIIKSSNNQAHSFRMYFLCICVFSIEIQSTTLTQDETKRDESREQDEKYYVSSRSRTNIRTTKDCGPTVEMTDSRHIIISLIISIIIYYSFSEVHFFSCSLFYDKFSRWALYAARNSLYSLCRLCSRLDMQRAA